MDEILQAHRELRRYIEKENYEGYDPYDALNTSIDWLAKSKWPSIILIQILKRLPFNIRPLLGIKKGQNPKGLGLMLHAYALDFKRTSNHDYLERMSRLFERLMELRSKGWDNVCWGYDFRWASPVKTLDKYSPTIVVTGFIAKGLRAYYEVSGKEEVLQVLKSIARFAQENLPEHRDDNGLCISYSTVKKDVCHNASLLAGEVSAALFALTGDSLHADRAREIARFTVSAQKDDGSWSYSRDLLTGAERIQTDFHQGYVIDSLVNIAEDLKTEEFDHCILKGRLFYKENQFHSDGRAYWRLPKKWPCDIHHQAQGIISFSEYETSFAKKILNYTLEHFRLGEGGFAYRKRRLFTDKIRYMRWANSWMYLAMSTYLYSESKS